MDDFELIKRLCLSAALGAVLGFEREWRQKYAGLRTNILIALGSTLFTLMSIDLSVSSGGDPTRVAAQIVTGIGFLGAGAIMRTGGGVRGLTTAAMIWVNAAIGVAVGGGEYRLALIATAVTVLVLVLLNPVENWIDRTFSRPKDRAAAGEPSEGGAAPAVEAPAGQPRPRQPR
ncbi:MAG TPA: MgtC/SapB family protein [Vicinamibacterales bacterium]|nr:MgtC/SapB family protein [Vicinamibacterales bacterium]